MVVTGLRPRLAGQIVSSNLLGSSLYLSAGDLTGRVDPILRGRLSAMIVYDLFGGLPKWETPMGGNG